MLNCGINQSTFRHYCLFHLEEEVKTPQEGINAERLVDLYDKLSVFLTIF